MDEHQNPLSDPAPTPAQQRLLRLFLMLPAPHTPPDDRFTRIEAKRFWAVMSQSLHPLSAGSIEAPQGDAAEEVMGAIAGLVHAQDQPRSDVIVPVESAFGRLATVAMEIFGDLSDEQRMVLGDALRGKSHRKGAWADQWLQLLRQTAMQVRVEVMPCEGDELAQLSSFWGDPRPTKKGIVQTARAGALAAGGVVDGVAETLDRQ